MSTIDPATISVEDIVDPLDAPTDKYDWNEPNGTSQRSATAMGASERSIRRALRSDLGAGRNWANAKRRDLEDAIRAEPGRAALYAVGAGVLFGLLARR
jgi:hypothetical protein